MKISLGVKPASVLITPITYNLVDHSVHSHSHSAYLSHNKSSHAIIS